MNPEAFIVLFKKYLQGGCSRSEIRQLVEAMDTPGLRRIAAGLIGDQLAEGAAAEGYSSPEAERLLEASLEKIRQRLQMEARPTEKRRPRSLFSRKAWWAAAVLLLVAGAAYWVFIQKPAPQNRAVVNTVQDFAPGHSGAVLHLSDGQTIVLDSIQNGTIAIQGQMKAIKTDGVLSYTGAAAANGETVYNTITTGKGRQWQLALPDGTQVWLNAASSLKYPLSFTGSNRTVEVSGEAYFEVAHNDRQPFLVKAGNELIEDIGTAFNVNTYTDEPAARTTLVEGSVKVTVAGRHRLLQPGEQAVVEGDKIQVNKADIENALAWKNGLFAFDRADIQTVMRQLSRWYNVEISFEGDIPQRSFSGALGRSLTLAQVLKLLSKTRINYRIEGTHKLIIIQ